MSAPQVDFGRAITYTFEEPRDRMKIVVICLFYFLGILTAGCLVGLLAFALVWGYQRRIALNVIAGTDVPMPEWDRWNEDLAEGLKILVIRFLYSLPGAVLLVGGYIAMVVGTIAAPRGGDPAVWVILIFMAGFIIGLPLILIGNLLGVLGTIRYIDTGELSSAFRIGEMFRFARENLGNLLLTLLLGIAAGFVSQIVGLLLLIIGSYFTPGWSYLVTGHAFGQVIRAHRIRQTTAASEVFV